VPKPVDTLDDLEPLAAQTPVATLNFTLPKEEREIETALWEHFANKPEEKQFAVVTAKEWKAKWRFLAETLVAKAEKGKLDGVSLRACLETLNMGLTRETAPQAIGEVPSSPLFKITRQKDGATVAEPVSPEKPAQLPPSKVQEQLPGEGPVQIGEPPDNGLDATIPVGAYFTHHAGGTCWIIVCKWEAADPSAQLGHIRVWAVDTSSLKIIGFVGCD